MEQHIEKGSREGRSAEFGIPTGSSLSPRPGRDDVNEPNQARRETFDVRQSSENGGKLCGGKNANGVPAGST